MTYLHTPFMTIDTLGCGFFLKHHLGITFATGGLPRQANATRMQDILSIQAMVVWYPFTFIPQALQKNWCAPSCYVYYSKYCVKKRKQRLIWERNCVLWIYEGTCILRGGRRGKKYSGMHGVAQSFSFCTHNSRRWSRYP